MATKLNINIRSLLFNCEELAKDETNYWRLKKFIKSLSGMIEELKEYDDSQISDKILEYTARLNALKTTTNYIDSNPMENSSTYREPHEDIVKEIRQIQTSKLNASLRKELIGDEQLRQRKGLDQGNMNEAVKFYNDKQQKITEHMLSLARSLKEQTETANRIVKKDTETLGRSSGMTDHNISSLNKESEKLEDHSRNACKCWMWLMIVFVIAVFIGTVLFMKIVKKRKS